ncbi:MAG: endonuclease/exonuclease/phosphatase family protein [Nitrospirae bacterium]|nr:endonuclease/exonuclease/phosphatase family protein [Nitrospirota bacterium]
MTYNVHGCVGTDGRLSPHRIARVIARYRPDVVCLQELDVGRARSGRMDQAHEIATALGMDVDFHAAMVIEDEHYGNAVLSRLPMRRAHAAQLPGDPRHPAREPRGALWVAVDAPFGPLQIITTHLGLAPAERRRQAATLTGPQWAGHPDFAGPGLVCGDFNALPGSPAHHHLSRSLLDVQAVLPGHRPRATWSGQYRLGRIDHMFLNGRLAVTAVEVPRTALTQVASDHLPLVADLCPVDATPPRGARPHDVPPAQ